MSGITKTIPQTRGVEAVEALYAGPPGEFEFHMAGKPARLDVGDYVYTIWEDQVVGRCEILRIESGHGNPESGKPQSLIYVRTPGEKLETPYPRKGHRGTRYYDGEGWGS